MKTVRRYLRDATDAIKDDRIEHAVWCIENAYSICKKREKQDVDLISTLIMEKSFSIVLDSFRATVPHIRAMLDYHATLAKEEWLLILTELSMAYSFARFNQRRNWKHDFFPEVSNLMESIRLATDSFTNPDMLSQLKGMRRHNPNPLPPPL